MHKSTTYFICIFKKPCLNFSTFLFIPFSSCIFSTYWPLFYFGLFHNAIFWQSHFICLISSLVIFFSTKKYAFSHHRSLVLSFMDTRKISLFSWFYCKKAAYRTQRHEGILQTYKLDNVDKMDQFFKNLKLPEITEDEIHNLNRPVTIKEIEFVV